MADQCECGIIHYVHPMGGCLEEGVEMFESGLRRWKLCGDCAGAYQGMLSPRGMTSTFLLKDPTVKK